MEEKIIDFQNVCRICLEKMDIMVSIFDGIQAPDLISYKDMIQECASIQVSIIDILPKKICIKCSEQLQLSYKLKIQCLLSEKIMQNFISKTKPHNIKAEQYYDEEFDNNDDIKNDNDYDTISDNIENTEMEIILKEENIENEIKENSELIKCELCDEIFLTQENYLSHYDSVHLFKCNLCEQILQSQVQFKKHLYTHKKQRVKTMHKIRFKKLGQGQPKLEYRCTECNKMFQFKSKLEQHMSVHSDENQYLCTYCGKALKSGSSLRVHLRTHTNEKPYCCKICGFKSGYPLRDHLISHSNERKYECEICKKSYARRNTLKRHIKTHSTERNFVCDICGKRFTFKHKLREHQYIHTGPSLSFWRSWE
ncbi:zinc finger protein 26-like isoform X2 [Chrysoperla carnea]|uniref:zinc finger protein 26-like isoform X2 n=1 Tax=Chrysoperla carnea TaxID=189513 RepID=UPI001D0639BA|nr:zinc finger protein 26-like isoform X2 [Chrysoperla carnea]